MTSEPLSKAFRFFLAHWKASRTLYGHLNPVLEERFGLELRDYLVLGSIFRGLHYPSEVADVLGMPRDMVSRILNKLLSKSLLERSIDEQDSRKTLLLITSEGIETRHKIRACIQDMIEPALEQLGQDGSEALIHSLEAFTQQLVSNQSTLSGEKHANLV
ncbi:MAG: winged helix-turn-helix transcriptional regulator [Trueperaceae bacterium]|nr:winged helix-turn-helix transcriptional regulator [Trueperaceae bacterium]